MTRLKTLHVISEQFSIQIPLIQVSLTVFGHILFRDGDRCTKIQCDARSKTDLGSKVVLDRHRLRTD